MLGSLGFDWWKKRKPSVGTLSRETTFHLWIDGVGGYLVCPGNQVTFGQATPHATIDVPLLADLSRLHATLTRDSEGYLLRTVKPSMVNDKPVVEALLRDNDLITLGRTCQLRFRHPAPVSASACLDLVSGHRLKPAVDGILLMSDTLLLGSGQQVHVPIPDLKDPIVLFRQQNELGIRVQGGVAINGKSVAERGSLKLNDRVEGEGFSFSLGVV